MKSTTQSKRGDKKVDSEIGKLQNMKNSEQGRIQDREEFRLTPRTGR
jgi:hypothetical protein